MGKRLKRLIYDRHGGGGLKFVLALCVVAFAAASQSPEYGDSPLLNGLAHHIADIVPRQFDEVLEALKRISY